MNKFKKGDTVRGLGGVIYTVESMPGDPEYDRFDYLDASNGFRYSNEDGYVGWAYQNGYEKIEPDNVYQKSTGTTLKQEDVMRACEALKRGVSYTMQKDCEDTLKEEFITNYKSKKQTIMNKISVALKKLLNKDDQKLYQVGMLDSQLELNSFGRDNYINALFQNDGDHKKAKAQMVEIAEEIIKDNENN